MDLSTLLSWFCNADGVAAREREREREIERGGREREEFNVTILCAAASVLQLCIRINSRRKKRKILPRIMVGVSARMFISIQFSGRQRKI